MSDALNYILKMKDKEIEEMKKDHLKEISKLRIEIEQSNVEEANNHRIMIYILVIVLFFSFGGNISSLFNNSNTSASSQSQLNSITSAFREKEK